MARTSPGLLIAGRNPVCADAVATAVLGYDPQAAAGMRPFPGENHLALAAAAGVGTHDLKRIEGECNAVIASGADVRIFEEDRVVVENKIDDRALLDLIPQSVRRLRVIEVGKADYCPCGGTHVKNVREIGRVHVLGKRSKGKETDRVEYDLVS